MTNSVRRTFQSSALAFVFGAALLAGPGAQAQQFPNRAITIVTNVGAGSNFDQLGRVFADRLRQKLGVPVVVENVTGGQGIIAAQRVLNAKSDGHTLLIAGAGLATTPSIMKNTGYKWGDFVTLAPIGQVPFILYASSAVPANDIASFMAYLKSNAKSVNSGILSTSHVAMLLSRKFGKAVGGDLTEIGYRSSPEMLIALLANDVQMMATTHAIGGQHVEAGKIKAIGVVAEERTKAAPDLPTFKEAGYPLTINIWQVLFAKSDIPADILAKIKEVSKEIISDPEYRKAMEPTGMEPWTIPFETVHAVVDNEAKAFLKEADELKLKFE